MQNPPFLGHGAVQGAPAGYRPALHPHPIDPLPPPHPVEEEPSQEFDSPATQSGWEQTVVGSRPEGPLGPGTATAPTGTTEAPSAGRGNGPYTTIVNRFRDRWPDRFPSGHPGLEEAYTHAAAAEQAHQTNNVEEMPGKMPG